MKSSKRARHTKYSVVLPDASLIPPLKIAEDVLWTWGVLERPVCALDDVMPPFRTVFPFNQPPTLARLDIAYSSQYSLWMPGESCSVVWSRSLGQRKNIILINHRRTGAKALK